MPTTISPTALQTKCPQCKEELHFPRPLRLGQAVECPYCEADLEVTFSDPLELLPALEDDEDDVWEYAYEEEDDDNDELW
jgi:lysine biosynthesis protein LysW